MLANAEFMSAFPVKPTLLLPGRRVTSGRRAVPRIIEPDLRFRVTLPCNFVSCAIKMDGEGEGTRAKVTTEWLGSVARPRRFVPSSRAGRRRAASSMEKPLS
jgi:hypothetical protein